MLRRCRLCLALTALAAGALPAAETRWPALDGDLSGVLRLDTLGDAPPLTWHARVKPSAEGPPQIDLEVTARGLVLHAQATLPPDGAPGTWRIADGAVDLAAWLPIALARADQAALPPDLAATGTLRFAGEGTWRDAEVSGSLTAALAGATAGSAAQNWSASGLTLAAEITLTKNLPALRAARVDLEPCRWRTSPRATSPSRRRAAPAV